MPPSTIYMDNHATTRVDPRVVEAMLPYFTEQYGNPGSVGHSFGEHAREAVETSRASIASAIGAEAEEIVFTSGATESNNLAIRGIAERPKRRGDHLVSVQTEHKAVLDPLARLSRRGYDVTLLEVEPHGSPRAGWLDPQRVADALRDDTTLVSVMLANNEIGVIQPLAEIGKICRERKVFFHTDAAQAAGKIPLDVEAMNIDLMSISGHKIYGPKGIGALYVRRKPRVRLVAMIHGGGQERGFRSGTLPTPLCVGLGEACEIAMKEMGAEAKRLAKLQERMLNGLRAKLTDIVVNGDLEQRIPGNLNISFAYVEGESLMMGIKNLSVSSGSACTSASLEPSYVLRALGVEEEMAHTSLRIGLGRFTTEHEVDTAVDELVRHVTKLREMSPLWEMAQEGIDLKSIEWAAH